MVKVNLNALEGLLQKNCKGFNSFLSYGNDNGLVYETASMVAGKINPDLNDPFNVIYLTVEHVKANPSEIYMQANTASLMGGRKLILIKNASDAVTAAMKEFFDKDTDAFVVLFGADLNKKSSLVQLMEKEEHAIAVGCYADDERSLRQLIAETFRSHGIKAEMEAVSFLVSKLGADRKLTRSELDKLLTYMGEEKNLTLDMAIACIDDVVLLSFDELAESIINRDAKKAMEALMKLTGAGESEVAVLRIIGGFLRKILSAAEAYRKSGSITEAVYAIKPRLNFKQEARIKEAIPKWSEKSLHKALDVLLQAEINCKTTDYPVSLICERALLQIASLR